MSAIRRHNREVKKSKNVLAVLIDKFFKESATLEPEEIRKKYRGLETLWKLYVANHNNSQSQKKKAFLMIDSFENSIMNAHKVIISSTSRTNKTKLQMLRVLRAVQGKSRFRYFLRELPIWVKYFFKEYKKKSKGVPKMQNPPAPPESIKNMKVTVNE